LSFAAFEGGKIGRPDRLVEAAGGVLRADHRDAQCAGLGLHR
jgi:hypothetical protein